MESEILKTVRGEEEQILEFLDEVETDGTAVPSWKLLIVDDEPAVHQATLFALRDMVVMDRKFEFLHAYSAAEARTVIDNQPDVAVILLDVVMESEHAGLDLVKVIREELKRDTVRIILRTGQPGYAPEIDTIRQLDINDYKTKSELTRVRLFTSLTVALRSYQQLQNLERTRQGLQLIVRGSTELGQLHGLQTFAEGVVTQLSALLDVPTEGLICAQEADSESEAPVVIAAAGRYRDLVNVSFAQIEEDRVRKAMMQCLTERRHILAEDCCLFFSTSNGRSIAAYINSKRALSLVDEGLIEVFCSGISAGLENVMLYSRLYEFAYTDALLKLPNRQRFTELIDAQLKLPQGHTVALVDIDDFADINSSMGHHYGDLLLKAVVTRLAQTLGPEVMLARVAGDTFGVLGSAKVVNPEVLLPVFGAPFQLNGQSLMVSASVGLVALDADSPAAVDVIKDAHMALKLAKTRQRSSAQYFSPDMGTQARERVRLLHSLKEAFAAKRLYVAYQPQVSLSGGQPQGIEALIRWRQEDGSLVPPDRFIPLAEKSGLIVALGEFVLRTSLQELRRLHDRGHTQLKMSVNVSILQLRDRQFLQVLSSAMQEAGVSASHVELEITESVAMENVSRMISLLGEIRATGVDIAVDDFGTGYSSLSALRQLGVQRLKIDKAFVQPLQEGGEQNVIAQLVIDLAKNLGMDVIAEGVETPEQERLLLGMGCPQGQGYLFSKPLQAEQLEAWLDSRSPAA